MIKFKTIIDEPRLTNLQKCSGKPQPEKALCLLKSKLSEVMHLKGSAKLNNIWWKKYSGALLRPNTASTPLSIVLVSQ